LSAKKTAASLSIFFSVIAHATANKQQRKKKRKSRKNRKAHIFLNNKEMYAGFYTAQFKAHKNYNISNLNTINIFQCLVLLKVHKLGFV
jgi:5-hydroxyisourate hydrolase-like protein (transthyretin family)